MLHFADLHIGMENYGKLDPATGTSSRVRDFLDRLDEVIDYALGERADLAVFSGDAFKNRDPNPTQQREFAMRIKRLADAVPTLLLVGNHDMPGMAAKASSIDIFRALDVPGVIVGYKPGAQVVETRRGPVHLSWLPYPMRNRLLTREESQGQSIEELELALRAVTADLLEGLSEQAREHEMPRVLAGHFSVEGAMFGSERSVMLGRDIAVFTSTLADPAWDYVALGHIHRHQLVNPGGYPPVVYCGSLERIDFGEEADEKGFCWVELARGETTWAFKPVSARPFRTVRIDVREASNATGLILDRLADLDCEGVILRVIVTLAAEQQAALREREIEAAAAHAASVTIVRDVQADVRDRLGGLSPQSLTPLELLERYFQSADESPERIPGLLSKAEELLRDPS